MTGYQTPSQLFTLIQTLQILKMPFLFFKFQAVEEHPLTLDAGGKYDVPSAK